MDLNSSNLPLTSTAFAQALRFGHGRALQHVQQYGATNLEAEILHACLSSLTHDPQCEDARAPWLLRLLQHTNLTSDVLAAIKSKMQEGWDHSEWDMEQRCDLLKEMARSGSDEARRLLYASLVKLPNSSQVLAATQIVELDGLKGLFHVARQYGRWLQDDQDFELHADWLLFTLDDSIDQQEALSALQQQAQNDADIARCLASCVKSDAPPPDGSKRLDVNVYSYDDILQLLETKSPAETYWFNSWGRKASFESLQIVYEALLKTSDAGHFVSLSRCFSKRDGPRFRPYFDRRLLSWLNHENEMAQWASHRLLSQIHHPEVRSAALDLIAQGRTVPGVAMLVENYEEGDWTYCLRYLKPSHDDVQTHQLVMALLDLFEAHSSPEAVDGLIYVYEASPCSICRSRAVRLMHHNHTLPQWMHAECAFDADADTRALVNSK